MTSHLVVLSSTGLANILMFWKYAASTIKLDQKNEEQPDISKIVASIQKETNAFPITRDEYESRIDKETAKDYVSDTLVTLFFQISDKPLWNRLPAMMIGNMITSVV